MSYDEKQITEIFLNWIKDGGLAGWIEHYLNIGDEAKLKEIAEVFAQLKVVFGF